MLQKCSFHHQGVWQCWFLKTYLYVRGRLNGNFDFTAVFPLHFFAAKIKFSPVFNGWATCSILYSCTAQHFFAACGWRMLLVAPKFKFATYKIIEDETSQRARNNARWRVEIHFLKAMFCYISFDFVQFEVMEMVHRNLWRNQIIINLMIK